MDIKIEIMKGVCWIILTITPFVIAAKSPEGPIKSYSVKWKILTSIALIMLVIGWLIVSYILIYKL